MWLKKKAVETHYLIYYNDNDKYCCQVLRERVADGQLPEGTVDDRNIKDVQAEELTHYRQIHLFAGIGGFPLALQLANFGANRSILTAGWPCTDLSYSGKGKGLKGEHSSLWYETLAAISVVRPEYFMLENVSALLTRGLDEVLGSLASVGIYDCQWHCVPAAYVGAPHRRDRIWIVGVRKDVADTEEFGQRPRLREGEASSQWRRRFGNSGSEEDVADTECERQSRPGTHGVASDSAENRKGEATEPVDGGIENQWSAECRLGLHPYGLQPGLDNDCGGWECGVPRVLKGQKDRTKRLKALGNAIVPQCGAFVLSHVLGGLNKSDH